MERIGYRFSNPVLLEKALTHSSYANEGRHGLESNERLEFLGDSVLGMIAAVYLFGREKQPEGALTKLRASIVCEKALCGYSRTLELGRFLLLGKGEKQNGGDARPSILADAFEAVVAAIYLDGGMEPARTFVMRFLEKEVEEKNKLPSGIIRPLFRRSSSRIRKKSWNMSWWVSRDPITASSLPWRCT